MMPLITILCLACSIYTLRGAEYRQEIEDVQTLQLSAEDQKRLQQCATIKEYMSDQFIDATNIYYYAGMFCIACSMY